MALTDSAADSGLDADGDITIQGGTIIATTNQEVVSNLKTGSQPVVFFQWSSTQSATSPFVIAKESDSSFVFGYDPSKNAHMSNAPSYSTLLVTSPKLSTGTAYNLYSSGTVTGTSSTLGILSAATKMTSTTKMQYGSTTLIGGMGDGGDTPPTDGPGGSGGGGTPPPAVSQSLRVQVKVGRQVTSAANTSELGKVSQVGAGSTTFTLSNMSSIFGTLSTSASIATLTFGSSSSGGDDGDNNGGSDTITKVDDYTITEQKDTHKVTISTPKQVGSSKSKQQNVFRNIREQIVTHGSIRH